MTADVTSKVGKNKPLTVERLKELLDYDRSTGQFLWKTKIRGPAPRWPVAGGKTKQGYVSIRIDGSPYFAHRLAWLFCFGEWPTHGIDHINRVRTDNRIENLRDVTNSFNRANSAIGKSNTSGCKGVYFHRGRWAAELKHEGKRTYLGSFRTPQLAYAAYVKASSKIPGRLI